MSKHPLLVAAAIGVLVALGAPRAQAAVYDFSYTANWGVVSGTIVGTLQPDNNTIFVTSIVNPEFDGVPGPALPAVTTLADYLGVPGPTTPELSFDGTNNNLLACTTPGQCFDGFYFDVAGVYEGYPQFTAGPSYSGGSTDLLEEFDASRWTVSDPIPEPPTWAMMALGFTGLGWAGYRRTRAV